MSNFFEKMHICGLKKNVNETLKQDTKVHNF